MNNLKRFTFQIVRESTGTRLTLDYDATTQDIAAGKAQYEFPEWNVQLVSIVDVA